MYVLLGTLRLSNTCESADKSSTAFLEVKLKGALTTPEATYEHVPPERRPALLSYLIIIV